MVSLKRQITWRDIEKYAKSGESKPFVLLLVFICGGILFWGSVHYLAKALAFTLEYFDLADSILDYLGDSPFVALNFLKDIKLGGLIIFAMGIFHAIVIKTIANVLYRNI